MYEVRTLIHDQCTMQLIVIYYVSIMILSHLAKFSCKKIDGKNS